MVKSLVKNNFCNSYHMLTYSKEVKMQVYSNFKNLFLIWLNGREIGWLLILKQNIPGNLHVDKWHTASKEQVLLLSIIYK